MSDHGSCPKCGQGKFTRLQYVPEQSCGGVLSEAITQPEHILAVCNVCGYGEKRPTAQQELSDRCAPLGKSHKDKLDIWRDKKMAVQEQADRLDVKMRPGGCEHPRPGIRAGNKIVCLDCSTFWLVETDL